MSESEAVGQRGIATVRATDADSGNNSVVRYALDDPTVPFSINTVTGVLVLARALDFEQVCCVSIAASFFLWLVVDDLQVFRSAYGCGVRSNVITVLTLCHPSIAVA
jgi:hypothetical protein